MISIIEAWTVVQDWWTPNPIYIKYAVVEWDDRIILFQRFDIDRVWRIRQELLR